jgi:hypothetical protein
MAIAPSNKKETSVKDNETFFILVILDFVIVFNSPNLILHNAALKFVHVHFSISTRKLAPSVPQRHERIGYQITFRPS